MSIASYTGVDKGELEAPCWEDLLNGDLFSRVKGAKTQKRKAPILVIPHLDEMLDVLRKAAGSPSVGWLFPADRGENPARMDNLCNRNRSRSEEEQPGLAWMARIPSRPRDQSRADGYSG